ncbi:MAG: RDD family protein [Pelosinus sp.]|nr:RDD family protein [Pelosinus sp.]
MYRILHTLWTTIVIILSPLILVVSVMASDAPNSKGLPTLIIFGVSLVIFLGGFYLIDKLPKKECALEYGTSRLMGENIPIRALANIIDICVTNALYSLLPIYKLGLGLIGGTTFFFCYFLLFEKVFSATPGKMILGLKIIMENGKVCSNKAVLIRCIAKTVDFFTLFLLSVINIFRSTKRQSIGDYFAKTLVIYKKKTVKF